MPPMPLRDDRRHLATMILWLLIATTAAAFILLLARRWTGVTVADVKELLTIVYPSLVALVATVTNSYFREPRS